MSIEPGKEGRRLLWLTQPLSQNDSGWLLLTGELQASTLPIRNDELILHAGKRWRVAETGTKMRQGSAKALVWIRLMPDELRDPNLEG